MSAIRQAGKGEFFSGLSVPPEGQVHQGGEGFNLFCGVEPGAIAAVCISCGKEEIFEIHPEFERPEEAKAHVLDELKHTHSCLE